MIRAGAGWAIGLAAIVVLSGCGAGTSAAGGGPGGRPGGFPKAPVTVTKPTTGSISAGFTISGDVTASQQVNLAPRISGIIVKLLADVGTQVKAGQEVAELDHASLDAAVTQAQAGLEVAQAKLAQIQAQGRPEDVAKANAALAEAQANQTNAQAALNAAQAKLQALEAGPRPEQVVIYQKAIDVAKNNLYSAQVNRDASCRFQTAASCTAGNATVNAMQTALDQANLQYQLNVAPPLSTDIAQAEDAVRQAQGSLDSAQAGVTSATNAAKEAAQPYVATDFQSAQAGVDSAKAQLSASKVNEQQAFVYAPFDGVISAKLLSEGALSSPSAPIFTLVSSAVEIDLPVAQEQIGQLKVGQSAQLTTPALAARTIDGKIETISPTADPKSRTFQVTVVPASQNGELKAGMSAAVTLLTVQKSSALLIPKDAVVVPTGGTGKPGVYVARNGPAGLAAVFVTPVFGVSNDTSTEVLSGLTPGDQIIVQGQTNLINNEPVRIAAPGGPGPAPGGSARPGGVGGAPSSSARASARPSGSGAASARPSASGSSAS